MNQANLGTSLPLSEFLHLFENELAGLVASIHHDSHYTETGDYDVAVSNTDANHSEADNDDDDDAASKSLVGRVRSRQVRRIFLLRQEKGEPVITTSISSC